MKAKKLQGYLWLWICLSLLGLTSNATAEFVVQDNEEEQSTTPYGNSQTPRFRAAVTGTSSISSQELEVLADILPEKEVDRPYLRTQILWGNRSLALTNRSINSWLPNAVAQPKVTDKASALELAWGYAWASFRTDVGLIFNKNFVLDATPPLSSMGSIYTLNSTLTHYSLLLNAYYDMTDLVWFQPYLMAGLGGSINTVDAALLDGNGGILGSNTKRNLDVAWSLGAGVRSRVFSNLYLDLNYRYFHMGGAKWKATEEFRLLGQLTTTAVGLGIIYLY